MNPGRGLVALLAVALAAVVAPAYAKPVKRSTPRVLVAHALGKRKLVEPTLKCQTRRGKTVCNWTAVRGMDRCSGKAVVKHTRPGVRARKTTLSAQTCDPVRVGFNTYTNDRTVGLQRQTGATVRRIFVDWANVSPVQNVWNWGDIDTQYKLALKSGEQPIMVATNTPCWARGDLACASGAFGAPPLPAHDNDWREFIRRTVDRYPDAYGLEIWNEPNLTQSWEPAPDPVRYTQLLAAAYTTAKALRPALPVISGGLLAHGDEGSGPGGMGDITFLTAMLKGGAGNSLDALGIHPYPQAHDTSGKPTVWDESVTQATLARWRRIATDNGAAHKHLWLTEIGESTGTQSGFPAAVSAAQQGADLRQLLENVVRARDVDVVVVHTLGDAPKNAGGEAVDGVLQPTTGISIFYAGVQSGFGVFDAADQPKPAACVLSSLLGGSLSC